MRAIEAAVDAANDGNGRGPLCALKPRRLLALAKVHDQFRKVLETPPPAKSLEASADKAKSDLEAQKAIDKLKAGT